MNDNQDYENTTEGRRRFLRAAAAAPPVIAALTARPVHAVQGLSNMASGDASGCRGDDFYGGWSPGFWKNPGGTTGDEDGFPPGCSGYPTIEAWALAGYDYGTLKDGGKPNDRDDYEGGSVVDAVDGSMPLREVLTGAAGERAKRLAQGLLNASFINACGLGDKYFINVTDYQTYLLNPASIPTPDGVPPSLDWLAQLVAAAEHGAPGDSCII